VAERKDLNTIKQSLPDIDWDIIAEHEGYEIHPGIAYYPDAGNSGITIGMGVDLARQTPSMLRKYGLTNPNLIAKISPYAAQMNESTNWDQVLGPINEQAEKMPHMQLSEEETAELNNAVGIDMYNKTAMRYYQETKKDFRLLPSDVKTTILSMTWNLGSKFKAPKTWDAIRREDWEGLGLELTQGEWEDNKDRRVNEGNYLLNSVYDRQYKD
tara:strand:+ start:1043 stop:1681 length:639 start_codon:yes stop_codon:yes gene_type:complete